MVALLDKGHVVYLHCWSGRGRAGTVSAALVALLYPELGWGDKPSASPFHRASGHLLQYKKLGFSFYCWSS